MLPSFPKIAARGKLLPWAFRRFRKPAWWTAIFHTSQRYVDSKLYRSQRASAGSVLLSPSVSAAKEVTHVLSEKLPDLETLPKANHVAVTEVIASENVRISETVAAESSDNARYSIGEEFSIDVPNIDMSGALILAELQDRDGAFETLIERCYIGELEAGMTAVDGGAHAGLHTGAMAKLVGPTGRIHAFEPLPFLADWLRQMFVNDPQVSIHEKALANCQGTATFNHIVEDPALSSLLRREFGSRYPGRTTEELQVTKTVLDDLVGEPVRFMKLDLEGYDFYALVGARTLLKRQRPIVTLEFGRRDAATPAGYGPGDFFDFFVEVGYQILDLYGRPFNLAEFDLPWDARHIPYYIVVAPSERTDIGPRLRKEAWALLQTAGA